MKRFVRIYILALLLGRPVIEAQEYSSILSELPLKELLAQKKIFGEETPVEGAPMALALARELPKKDVHFKGLHRLPAEKTFHDDDYEDEKDHNPKKKEKEKMNDILNTSIMVLSYLAFGGYLLCMIATALREKRRRFAMAYPATAPAPNNQLTQVLQHFMSHGHRPGRPFIRFPSVTLHQGGKKRRRRFTQKGAPRGEPQDWSPFINIIDYFEILFRGSI